MSNPAMSDGMYSGSEPTLGALVAAASRDASDLVRAELDLAKAEIRETVKTGSTAGAMFGAAAYLVILATILLSVAAAYGLVAAGLDAWLAFLIVAVAYILIAVVLALVGKKLVARLGPPERAIRTSKETAAYLKGQRSADEATPTRT